MEQFTLKEAVERFGTEGHKNSYKKKYSLTKKQKIELEKIMFCEFEEIEFSKNDKGHIIISVDKNRKVKFPKLSKSNIFGNNSKDELNVLLFQYVINFLENNDLSEEGYYNLVFLESKFDILTNFTRQFVKYETGLAIARGNFTFLKMYFPYLNINKMNRALFETIHNELNRTIKDFRESLLDHIHKKSYLYRMEEVKGAVIGLEDTQFNERSREQEIPYDLRGRYDNLSIVMKEHHDNIINRIKSVNDKGLTYEDIFNKEDKTFDSINFINETNNQINIEIPSNISEDIANKINTKMRELNLLKIFHWKLKPNYFKTENFRFFTEDEEGFEEELEVELIEEEIEKLKSLGQFVDEENEFDYMGLTYYIGNDGNNLILNDRLKLLDKYKKKYYRLKDDENYLFYEISYFPTYYKFKKNMIEYPEFIEHAYDYTQVEKNNNLSEITIKIRNILKKRFEKNMGKEIKSNYEYLGNRGLDRLLMNEIVEQVSALILHS